MYMQSQAAAEQADAQKKAARQQAEAEAAAGEARRKQVLYNAQRQEKSMLGRQGAAGVQIDEGSLLENEMAFASAAEYDAQLAAYPHALASQAADYQSKLFGYSANRARSMAWVNTGLAVTSSLASSYGSYGSSLLKAA